MANIDSEDRATQGSVSDNPAFWRAGGEYLAGRFDPALPKGEQLREWDSPRRIRFMRSMVAGYFDYLAQALIVEDLTEGKARSDGALAIEGINKHRLDGAITFDEMCMVHKLEWQRANANAERVLAAIKQAVRGLFWDGADGRRILAAAEAEAERLGAYYDDVALTQIALQAGEPIIKAKARRGRRR